MRDPNHETSTGFDDIKILIQNHIRQLPEGTLCRNPCIPANFDSARHGASDEVVDMLVDEELEKLPALYSLRNQLLKKFPKTEPTTASIVDTRAARQIDEIVYTAINLTSLTLSDTLTEQLDLLEADAATDYIDHVLMLTEQPKVTSKIIQAIYDDYPEFAELHIELIDRGARYIESMKSLQQQISPNSFSEIELDNLFERGVAVTLLPIAAAFGLTDKIEKTGAVQSSVIELSTQPKIAPHKLFSRVIRQSVPNFLHFDQSIKQFDETIDFDNIYDDAPALNRAMSQLDYLQYIDLASSEQLSLQAKTVLQSYFRKYLFAVANTLHSATDTNGLPLFRPALSAIDQEILTETAPVAYRHTPKLQANYTSSDLKTAAIIKSYPSLISLGRMSTDHTDRYINYRSSPSGQYRYAAAIKGSQALILNLIYYCEQTRA